MKYILFFIILFSLSASAQTEKYPLQNKTDVNKPDTLPLKKVTSTRYTKGAILPYKEPVIIPPPTNKIPIVKTGPDLIITTNSVVLNGSGSYDPDGNIIEHVWTLVKGLNVVLTPSGASVTITGLVSGQYTFGLTVKDDGGATAFDTVHVSVNVGTPPPPPPNLAPTVTTGPAQTITLPVSSVILTGSATDADGTIGSYLWTKVSGATGAIINSPGATSTTVTGLTSGAYLFNLKATDNLGASGNKSVSITVNTATLPPPSGYTLTFSTGYDQMSDITTDNGQYGNGTVSTTFYKTGPGSFYSQPKDVSSGTRSEVQYTGTAQNPIEGAIEYDVFYEVIIPNNGCSIQWHPNTPGSSGSPFLAHEGGKFVWKNWKSGNNASYSTGVTIAQNRWLHMRMEYKFGSNGYWRHFIDGVQVGGWTGQVGDGSGQYLKLGYNGWDPNSTSGRIYYDNLKIYKKS